MCSSDLASIPRAVDLVERDPPLGVNQEGAAHGHARLVVEHAVGLSDGAVRPEVRQQREVEALLLAPRLEGGGRVGAEREHRSEEHTSELQSRQYLVCRLLLEKKNNQS